MDSQKLDELLEEELTGSELSELLERLGAEEFGGSENSRLRDVVELTGQEPLSVARVLADIRKEDWEERFGSILEDHGERIERLERQERAEPRGNGSTHRVPIPDPYLSSRFGWRSEWAEEADELRSIWHDLTARPLLLAFLACIAIAFIVFIVGQLSISEAPDDYGIPESTIVLPNSDDMTPSERAAIERLIEQERLNGG